MLFDEDTTLLSFFENFSDPEEEQELKENIIKYVGGGNFGGAQVTTEENSTVDSLDEVSFPDILIYLDVLPTRFSGGHEKKETPCDARGREITGCSEAGGVKAIWFWLFDSG